MKEYDVSLEILVNESIISRSQLAQVLGIESQHFNHKKIEQGALWKIESDCAKHQPLNEQVLSILSKIKSRDPIKTSKTIKGTTLNIGVFYDTVTCTVILGGEYLSRLVSSFPDITIEVTCYPSND
jgi:hypothetical protein